MTEAADQTTIDNELRGALFKNDKGDNDKRPDYRGRCTIQGQEYKISAWIRTARSSGQKFLSMAFTAADKPDNDEPPF